MSTMLAEVGQPVPDIAHAVSVSLPSWKAVVGYEEGEEWVISKMRTGYPRFFIHLTIQELETQILQLYGRSEERVMLFPSRATAKRCQQFLYDRVSLIVPADVRLVHLEPITNKLKVQEQQTAMSGLHCVFFPPEHFSVAKQVWQHSGDGISSRRAEFCLKALKEGILQAATSSPRSSNQDLFSKGPRRYQRGSSQNGITLSASINHDTTTSGQLVPEGKEHDQFIEERFGRNLNTKLAYKAKLAVRRRISGCLVDDMDLEQGSISPPRGCDRRLGGLSEDDVYLYPTGMAAIFNAHRILMALARSQGREPEKTVCFGFPYIDTLKVLEKWGPGCLFYGRGVSEDLDDLERRLESGERFLGLFTEFPSNPLLRSPDILRIRKLADKYHFAVVVDETVGNFININVLQYADIVVSSLTKIFSGDCNVMSGSYLLNPQSSMYQLLKQINLHEYEDNLWAEDAVYLERNSRDFVSRIERINTTSSKVAKQLQASPITKEVYYPEVNPSRPNYDACRNPNGGYGGLLSVTFTRTEQAIAFFDTLKVEKGPSLGTNFTLTCPYTVLAHYMEMDWTSKFGVDPDLVRISVGLEDEKELLEIVQSALDAAALV